MVPLQIDEAMLRRVVIGAMPTGGAGAQNHRVRIAGHRGRELVIGDRSENQPRRKCERGADADDFHT